VRVVESAGAFSGGVTSRGADPAELAAGLREDGRRALAARVAEVLGAGRAELVVLQGDPPDEVVAWASQAGCDLLVAAAHRSRLARAILGSFTQAVARRAPCPVLVHRTH